jgi:hypothetical protein
LPEEEEGLSSMMRSARRSIIADANTSVSVFFFSGANLERSGIGYKETKFKPIQVRREKTLVE